jgi:platelet-activating factor acetylhydrolase
MPALNTEPTLDTNPSIESQPRQQSSARDNRHASKQPKSRPPAGMREKILTTPLPHYSGPYGVGFMDIEVPVREPRTFSEIKRDHRHLLQLETVLFSVFYPSGFGSGSGPSPEGKKKWGRATWLPRPRVDLAKGYAKFAGVAELPMVAWFGWFSVLDIRDMKVSN